jgi:hypothetical protein
VHPVRVGDTVGLPGNVLVGTTGSSDEEALHVQGFFVFSGLRRKLTSDPPVDMGQ